MSPAVAMGATSAVVIGPGRVGRAISRFYHPPAPLLSRGQELPRDISDTPVWVCTTNDGLDTLLQHTAVTAAQRQQLIFVQNGMLLPWLAQHGLERNTQVLLYMSATEDGTVTDGLRTAVCGPWAQHVAATLHANHVRCQVVEDWQLFRQLMLVKLLWSCIFWLLSAGLGGKPVGIIAQHHQAEVSVLVEELLPLGQQYLQDFQQQRQQQCSNSSDSTPMAAARATGIAGDPAAAAAVVTFDHATVMQQLLSYSLAISAAVPSVDMARREFAWRNGFFLALPHGQTPQHCQWLQRAGCSSLIPSRSSSHDRWHNGCQCPVDADQ